MMKLFFIAATVMISTRLLSQSKLPYLLIGTYTKDKSEGLYVYNFNTLNGDAAKVSVINTDNPSFLAVSPDEKFVYAVNENSSKNNMGSVAAFSFDKNSGALSLLNSQSSGGNGPCYVATHKSGKWVTAANYSGGSVVVLPVKADGSLGEASDFIQHTGKSTDIKRQDKPHVHSTFFSPDNKQLLAPDLGTDKVVLYDFDDNNGKLTPSNQPFFKVQDGAGPRHLAFHPNGKFVYLMEEMAGNVVAFRYNKGALQDLQCISSHPEDFTGFKGSADIHVSPDGRFLYASNRGDANSIAIFSIDQKNGKLKTAGFQSCMGKMPRNFTIDPTGNFLLVANQASNDIIIFKRDKKTGMLTDTGKRIQVDKPVCLQWINSN